MFPSVARSEDRDVSRASPRVKDSKFSVGWNGEAGFRGDGEGGWPFVTENITGG